MHVKRRKKTRQTDGRTKGSAARLGSFLLDNGAKRAANSVHAGNQQDAVGIDRRQTRKKGNRKKGGEDGHSKKKKKD